MFDVEGDDGDGRQCDGVEGGDGCAVPAVWISVWVDLCIAGCDDCDGLGDAPHTLSNQFREDGRCEFGIFPLGGYAAFWLLPMQLLRRAWLGNVRSVIMLRV